MQLNIFEEEEKNPDKITPILLPFSKNNNLTTKIIDRSSSNNTNKELFHLNENEFFMLQFPRVLPFLLPSQENQRNKETDIYNINNNSSYSNNNYLNETETNNTNNVKLKENKEQTTTENNYRFKSSFEGVHGNFKIGKLKIYKSGKMKLVIGDNTFDVTQGMKNSFLQEVALEDNNNDIMYNLGKVKPEKLIISPSI